MNEHDALIYTQLKVQVSLDLYENFNYVAKLNEPFEFRYVVYGDHHTSMDEIESVVDAISNKIRDYLFSELNK